MITQAEFRERLTEAILEVLAELSETQRNIFVWNHYDSYRPKQIAEILSCSPSEVEAALDATNRILYQRTRSLLKEDPWLHAGIDPFRGVTPQQANSLNVTLAAELSR